MQDVSPNERTRDASNEGDGRRLFWGQDERGASRHEGGNQSRHRDADARRRSSREVANDDGDD
jgi:hypothetical protein